MATLASSDLVVPRTRQLGQVLCAVDPARGATDAVGQAVALAPCASRLRFICVIGADGHAPSLEQRRALQALSRAETVAQTRGIRAELELVRAGDPAAVLLERGDDDTILVSSTHGDSRALGAAAGSATTAPAHAAVGPMLVVRPGSEPAEVPRRILVAVDDDASAGPAVRLAGTIAARCGGYVHLVHVQGHDYGAHTRHRLAVLGTELVELTGAEPVVDVLRGSHVAAQVSALAGRSGSSLLVAGRRGLTGLRALGSVSERLVQTAPCSVLLVPLSH